MPYFQGKNMSVFIQTPARKGCCFHGDSMFKPYAPKGSIDVPEYGTMPRGNVCVNSTLPNPTCGISADSFLFGRPCSTCKELQNLLIANKGQPSALSPRYAKGPWKGWITRVY